MEWIDVYDGQRRRTGRKKPREQMFSAGEYRLTAFTVIANFKGEVLLTLRDPKKRIYPNVWGHTGGAVQAGESSRRAIAREVAEEIGIKVYPREFTFLWTAVNREHCSFTDLYLLMKDVKLSDLKLQPGETVDAKWVSFAEFDEMIKQNQIAAPDAARWDALRAAVKRNLKNRRLPD